MKIRKIQIQQKTKLVIHYEQDWTDNHINLCRVAADAHDKINHFTKETKFTTDVSKMHPDFREALKQLEEPIQDFCHQQHKVDVTGISIDYQEGKSDNEGEEYNGIVIIGTMQLADSDCPLNIISPRKTNRDSDIKRGVGFNHAVSNIVYKLIEEAESCIKGKTAEEEDLFSYKQEPQIQTTQEEQEADKIKQEMKDQI